MPSPRARPEIHDRVRALVARLPPAAGKTALDAPLGPGAMALHLHQIGYAVSGVDIDIEQSRNLPPAIRRTAGNLNGRLPYGDGEFDLVTSLEGIEHVENHFFLLREFSRVTKLGGHLIISTPNVCNLEERLNFLMRGTLYHHLTREEVARRGTGFDHQNLIGYVQLRQALAWAGFEPIHVEPDKVKRKQDFCLFPLWLLVRAYVALQPARRKTRFLLEETASRPVLLGGNTIILLTRKTGAATGDGLPSAPAVRAGPAHG
jgi:SAM-dependent methyltransferase